MKIYNNDIWRGSFRFSEILDRYYCKDGRLSFVFEDQGYVENINVFLTGCMSCFPVYIYVDGSKPKWVLLNGHKKIKTLVDFYEGKIKCQGLLFSELEGYLKARITSLYIEFHSIYSGAEDKQDLINFLKQ